MTGKDDNVTKGKKKKRQVSKQFNLLFDSSLVIKRGFPNLNPCNKFSLVDSPWQSLQ